jgi:hypothetical protein
MTTQIAYKGPWAAAAVEIILDDDMTDDPVATAEIVTPVGRLMLMAEVSFDDRVLVLAGLHMHGEDVGPNRFGAVNLRRLADAVMERLDCDEIVVAGAIRRTGANPGRLPREIRFKRRLRA